MQTISSIMKTEHDNILLVVDAIEKNARELKEFAPLNVDLYIKIIDFQRNYTDGFHHAKEEEILFPVLEKHDATSENKDIKLLIHEHILSRAYIENIEKAISNENAKIVSTNALEYCVMIREHITREDSQLFPLVEKLLPMELKSNIIKQFKESESLFPKGTYDKYMAIAKEIRKLSGLH